MESSNQTPETTGGKIPQPQDPFDRIDRDCEIHGTYTSVRPKLLKGMKGIAGFSACPECAESERKRMAEINIQIERETADRKISDEISSARIPKRFSGASFDNYRAMSVAQQMALDECRGFAEKFGDVMKSGRCLILAGRLGTGKTHLLMAILNHLVRARQSVRYVRAANLIRELRATWGDNAGFTELELIENYRDLDLLGIDEIGIQFGTDAEKVHLFDIIDARYMEMKPTVIATNLDVEGLKAYMGERLIDRMRENGGKLVVFDWESHRIA